MILYLPAQWRWKQLAQGFRWRMAMMWISCHPFKWNQLKSNLLSEGSIPFLNMTYFTMTQILCVDLWVFPICEASDNLLYRLLVNAGIMGNLRFSFSTSCRCLWAEWDICDFQCSHITSLVTIANLVHKSWQLADLEEMIEIDCNPYWFTCSRDSVHYRHHLLLLADLMSAKINVVSSNAVARLMERKSL